MNELYVKKLRNKWKTICDNYELTKKHELFKQICDNINKALNNLASGEISDNINKIPILSCYEKLLSDREQFLNIVMILENYEDYKNIVKEWNKNNINDFWEFLRDKGHVKNHYLKLFLFETEESNVEEYIQMIENNDYLKKYWHIFDGMIRQIEMGLNQVDSYKNCVNEEKSNLNKTDQKFKNNTPINIIIFNDEKKSHVNKKDMKSKNNRSNSKNPFAKGNIKIPSYFYENMKKTKTNSKSRSNRSNRSNRSIKIHSRTPFDYPTTRSKNFSKKVKY